MAPHRGPSCREPSEGLPYVRSSWRGNGRAAAWELPLLRFLPFPPEQGELPRSPVSFRDKA